MDARTSRWAASWRVLWLLVFRDLRLRYAGTFLGYLWTVLEPLAMAGVYWFVFTEVFKARRVGDQPYVLFLVVGMLAWNWFSASLNEGCKSLTGEAKIVRSSNLPREIWVARTVVAKMIEFILAIPVIAFFMIIFHMRPDKFLIFFPIGMTIQFVLTLGIVLALAPLTVVITDIPRVIRILLRVGLYLTPVLYSLQAVPPPFDKIAAFNPLSGVLSLYRIGIWPDSRAPMSLYLISIVISLAWVVIGLFTFRRLEGTILKEI